MSKTVEVVNMECPVCHMGIEITIELGGRKSPNALFAEELEMTYNLTHGSHMHSQHTNMYVLEETIVETGSSE